MYQQPELPSAIYFYSKLPAIQPAVYIFILLVILHVACTNSLQ